MKRKSERGQGVAAQDELVRMAPPEALVDSVEFVAQRRALIDQAAFPVFPTARAELIFHFADPFLVGESISDARPLPPAALLRPRRVPYIQIAGPAISWFMVALTPAGCRRLLRAPMAALWTSDRSLTDFWNGAAMRLHERFATTTELDQRMAFIASFLEGLDGPDGDVAVGKIAHLARLGRIRSIPEMCEALGVGPRRLRQRFVAEIGVPPKTWLSVLRFGRHLSATHPAPWRRDEAACGTEYVDESHATRAFRRFASVTPGAYRKSKAAGDPLVFMGAPIALNGRDGPFSKGTG